MASMTVKLLSLIRVKNTTGQNLRRLNLSSPLALCDAEFGHVLSKPQFSDIQHIVSV